MIVVEIGKDNVSVIIATVATWEKSFTENLNLIAWPPLKKLVLLDQDNVRSIVTTSKMGFLEKGRESQKYNNFKFCDNLP